MPAGPGRRNGLQPNPIVGWGGRPWLALRSASSGVRDPGRPKVMQDGCRSLGRPSERWWRLGLTVAAMFRTAVTAFVSPLGSYTKRLASARATIDRPRFTCSSGLVGASSHGPRWEYSLTRRRHAPRRGPASDRAFWGPSGAIGFGWLVGLAGSCLNAARFWLRQSFLRRAVEGRSVLLCGFEQPADFRGE
jgi:hypothetical protein